MKKVNILKIARVLAILVCAFSAVFLLVSLSNIFALPQWLMMGLSLIWFLCGALVLWIASYANDKISSEQFIYTIRYRRKKKLAEGEDQGVAPV